MMNRKYSLIFLFILIVLGCVLPGQEKSDDFPVLKGPYLGQQPPGMTPELFPPGIISKGMNEAAIAFSPDGEEVYYNIMHLTHGYTAIVFVVQENGRWTKPQVAAFSGKYNDSDAFFSQNGQALYFTSDRPLETDGRAGDLDIWFVEKNKSGWSEPKNLGSSINSEFREVNPC